MVETMCLCDNLFTHQTTIEWSSGMELDSKETKQDFPGGPVVKESTCQRRELFLA